MPMNVLFIAYYFEPFTGVGAKRITYWAKNIKRLDPRINKCHVITTTIQVDKVMNGVDEIFVVPTSSNSFLGKVFKFDPGAAWLKSLELFFTEKAQHHKYDYVVLTGNPFFHFFILRKLKKMGIKSIIDFRDPLANNPRSIKADSLKRKVKSILLRLVEKYFIKTSSLTITVNQYCAELLSGFERYREKVYVIDNGFDEHYFSELPEPKVSSGPLNLVYAGSLYADRSASSLINAILDNEDFIFNHIGNINPDLEEIDNVISHGLKSYPETIKLMNDFQITVIFTSGYNFESTTKIFDYIALNKTILILTEGQLKTGALYDITKSYPNVFWAKNNVESISNVLAEIKSTPFSQVAFEKMKYSREAGLKQLINLMK